MKLRSSIVAFYGVLFLIVFPLFQNHVKMDYYEIVTKSFTATNAERSALIIKGWAKINLTTLNENQLENEFKSITKKLNMPFNPTKERYGDFIKYQQVFDTDSALIEISLQSYPSETYLETIITLDSNYQYSKKYYSRVQELLSPYSQKDLGITLIGTFKGLLNEEEKQQIINTAFQSVNALLVEGINTDSLISYSGYTESCPDYLLVAGKKINIGIGLRYHILDNKTYLNIGAPLIFQEY
ncbi:MAG: hypothetical protein GX923_01245 [Clostridia bacterium]|nr:hypothetical protein [Clostridia bacterium]